MTRAIGKRQAGALTVLWVMHPLAVKGHVLGDVLAPGESSIHARRALSALALRGLIDTPYLGREEYDALRVAWRITNDGIFALRRYALARGEMTVVVVG